MSEFLCDMKDEREVFVGIGVFEIVPSRGDTFTLEDTTYLVVGRHHNVATSVEGSPSVDLIVRNKSTQNRI